MSSYTRHPMGRECPPSPDNPAVQPLPPGDGKGCCELPKTKAPDPPEPAPCPDPDPCCGCLTLPGSTTPNCLEELIAKQTVDIDAADQANKFKADLEKLLENAKKSSLAFTRDKYDDYVTRWLALDADIAELLRKLECAVWCWHCILDCYVCPLLNDLHQAEKWLSGDGQPYTEVHNLYDLQYWCQRDLDAKKRRLGRIEAVMKAWGFPADPKDWASPADTIDKALTANKGLVDSASKVIGTEPGKAIYDVFLRLVPMHLAIAPPATSGTTTKIDEKFTTFCECNTGTPDDCCGPDVGELSLRQRLIGPQPYLIDPNDYFKLICCLVENRWVPAKNAWSKAVTDLAAVGNRIVRNEAQFNDKWVSNFETAAKGAIPSVINCCDYEPDNQSAQKTSRTH